MNLDLVALAPRELEEVLAGELGSRVVGRHGRLFLLRGQERPLWAQNIWLKPEVFSFQSISEASNHLRAIQRNWWLHSVGHHRRAKLIVEKLPPLKAKRIDFLSTVPAAPLGSWTLLDEGRLLYSAECTSPFPDGEIEFNENKNDPPSRAYLKLWEFFTLTGMRPQAGERVIDLGSSPGGWTWVLDQLGCEVISVDKAPLGPQLRLSGRVQFREESAFALKPEKVDWMFSDIICYPERLLELVESWKDYAGNLFCTIKFQEPTNYAAAREFLKIPGSRILHLSANKHELSWFRPRVHG